MLFLSLIYFILTANTFSLVQALDDKRIFRLYFRPIEVTSEQGLSSALKLQNDFHALMKKDEWQKTGFDFWEQSFNDRHWGYVASSKQPANFEAARNILLAKGYEFFDDDRFPAFKPVNNYIVAKPQKTPPKLRYHIRAETPPSPPSIPAPPPSPAHPLSAPPSPARGSTPAPPPSPAHPLSAPPSAAPPSPARGSPATQPADKEKTDVKSMISKIREKVTKCGEECMRKLRGESAP